MPAYGLTSICQAELFSEVNFDEKRFQKEFGNRLSPVWIKSRFIMICVQIPLSLVSPSLQQLANAIKRLPITLHTNLQQIHFRNSPHIFGIKSEFPQILLFMQICFALVVLPPKIRSLQSGATTNYTVRQWRSR